MVYDRYVSNKVLRASLRPQKKYWCSITSMASAVQSLIGKDVQPKEILNINEWSKEKVRKGKVTNEDYVNGLNKYFKVKDIKAKAEIFLDTVPTVPRGEEKIIEDIWERIKKTIKNKNEVLIYHEKNHYTNIAGFYEEPITYKLLKKRKRSFHDRINWIIIAEHSTNKEDNWPPIRMIRWYDVKKVLRKKEIYKLIKISLNN